MLLCRDSAIKLFGTTISLQFNEGPTITAVSTCSESSGEDVKDYKINNSATPGDKEQGAQSSDSQDEEESLKSENLKQDSSVTEDVKAPDSVSEENSKASSDSKVTLKKPDKILPCPRCCSMETKFCYYNNYNINQPRHFCKSCQRYWTAGGTMRNVPVGAGRRKSKSSVPQYRELTICNSTFQAVHRDVIEPLHHSEKPNGTVLSFGSDTTVSIPISSALSHTEKTHKRFKASYPSTENGNTGNSTESKVPTSTVTPCINGVPWPYPWAPVAAFSTAGITVPLYPATYWTSAVPSSDWNATSIAPITSNTINYGSKGEANSIALGKHSRDGNALKNVSMQNDEETSRISVPKLMRIDDPQEIVKSSIWTSIGRRHCEGNASKDIGFLRGFQNKVEIKNHAMEASRTLHANPASLARSVTFQESS